MNLSSAKKVIIYVGSSDTWEGTNLAAAIVERCRAMGLAGATATRGNMGFGKNSIIHRGHLLGLSEDLPERIEIIDQPARIAEALPVLEQMVGAGLIVVQDVAIVARGHGSDALLRVNPRTVRSPFGKFRAVRNENGGPLRMKRAAARSQAAARIEPLERIRDGSPRCTARTINIARTLWSGSGEHRKGRKERPCPGPAGKASPWTEHRQAVRSCTEFGDRATPCTEPVGRASPWQVHKEPEPPCTEPAGKALPWTAHKEAAQSCTERGGPASTWSAHKEPEPPCTEPADKASPWTEHKGPEPPCTEPADKASPWTEHKEAARSCTAPGGPASTWTEHKEPAPLCKEPGALANTWPDIEEQASPCTAPALEGRPCPEPERPDKPLAGSDQTGQGKK